MSMPTNNEIIFTPSTWERTTRFKNTIGMCGIEPLHSTHSNSFARWSCAIFDKDKTTAWLTYLIILILTLKRSTSIGGNTLIGNTLTQCCITIHFYYYIFIYTHNISNRVHSLLLTVHRCLTLRHIISRCVLWRPTIQLRIEYSWSFNKEIWEERNSCRNVCKVGVKKGEGRDLRNSMHRCSQKAERVKSRQLEAWCSWLLRFSQLYL